MLNKLNSFTFKEKRFCSKSVVMHKINNFLLAYPHDISYLVTIKQEKANSLNYP